MAAVVDEHVVLTIERPHSNLLTYYVITSLLWGPFCVILAVLRYVRYRTIRYQFTQEEVRMHWGGLIHREVSVAYSRIQDIHISSGVIERWLNLARIEIQTASGGSQAELTLEGLIQYHAVRDFLYARIRSRNVALQETTTPYPGVMDPSVLVSLVETLQQTAADMREIRVVLERAHALRDGEGV